MLPSSGSAGQSRVHQWGAVLSGLPGVRYRGQRLVADVDGRCRVCGGVGVRGNHGRYSLTLESGHLIGQDPVNGNAHARQDPVRWQWGHLVKQVRAGDNGHHTRNPGGPVR